MAHFRVSGRDNPVFSYSFSALSLFSIKAQALFSLFALISSFGWTKFSNPIEGSGSVKLCLSSKKTPAKEARFLSLRKHHPRPLHDALSLGRLRRTAF